MGPNVAGELDHNLYNLLSKRYTKFVMGVKIKATVD